MSFRTMILGPLTFGPNTGFQNPDGDTPIYETEPEPLFDGASGGVTDYRGPQSDVIKTGYPRVTGQDQLAYASTNGIPDTVSYLAPAPGSSDLIAPRQAFGIVGSNRNIKSVGPVTGRNTEFRSGLTPLNAPNTGNAGPVAGGPDYSETVTQNYYAQLAMYSAEAANNSLLVSF